NPKFEEMTKPQEEEQEPMLFTRYFGAQIAMVDYTEVFSGKDLNSQTWMFGLKLTGPGYLIEEVPLDIDLMVAIEPPKYYDESISTSPTTGFLLFSNVALKVPFIDQPNSIIYYSLGLTGSYTNFKVTVGTTTFDSQEVKIGATAGFGAAMRFKQKYFIQVDWKYFYEKTQYMGYSASFGFKY
ncbi:MAG: hypothetical protein KDD40_03410, partial [Bdellovibrionales bacterium]|nr:hypothetical protein [Bdellovibrionales bacterium]